MKQEHVLALVGLAVGAIAIIVTVLGVSPEAWSTSLGTWAMTMRGVARTDGMRLAILLAIGYGMFRVGLSRGAKHAYADPERRPVEYPSLLSALPHLWKRLGTLERNEGRRRVIDIIAATGGTILPVLAEALKNKAWLRDIDVRILLIDDEAARSYCARWIAETAVNAETLRGLDRTAEVRGNRIEVRRAKCFPTFHGVLLDGKDLLFGFFGWSGNYDGAELAGADRRCMFFERGAESHEFFVEAFRNWFEHEWRVASGTMSAVPGETKS